MRAIRCPAPLVRSEAMPQARIASASIIPTTRIKADDRHGYSSEQKVLEKRQSAGL